MGRNSFASADSLPCDDEPRSNSRLFPMTSSKRRRLFITWASLVVLSLLTLAFFHSWADQSSLVDESHSSGDALDVDSLDPLASLTGPPTSNFRDNLRSDVQYITSFPSAGWTNDVMTFGNLLYLALITDRVPIIPMFTPSHILRDGMVDPLPFGEVFDLPRLQKALGRPVLEWRDVKDVKSEAVDELGCWNVWQSVQYNEAFPRHSWTPVHVNLDISYTQTPSSVKLIPNYEHDMHSSFWSLAHLAYPEGRAANLVTPRPSNLHNVSLPPDEQLLCYDYLYYVCAYQPFEYEHDYSPAWKDAARHMRWTKRLDDLADSYVRRAIGIEDDNMRTPPYIAIHIRHGDFANWCYGTPVDQCFASLEVIARRVREVQDEVLQRKGISVEHVLMTSDERDPTWWEDVAKLGWLQIDHAKTVENYGLWYPVLIDAVIQSNGLGFVGTDRSTMSTIARRRVQSWHDGVARIIRWGTPHADNH